MKAEEDLERSGEEVTEGAGDVETSYGRTSLESKEFLRRLDLTEDQLAEAGVVGVLKAWLEAVDIEEEKDVVVAEGTADSPMNDFCSAAIVGKSIPDVIMAMGFHASISNWGVVEGEPRAEEDAEAPDSEEAERIGG
jgi:hypothetical protein